MAFGAGMHVNMRAAMNQAMNAAMNAAISTAMNAAMHMTASLRMHIPAGAFSGTRILIGAVLAAILLQGSGVALLIGPETSISPNSGASSVVVAVASIESQTFGTKAMDGDGDVGRMIYSFSQGEPVFVYWDVGLIDNKFDSGDVAYLHVNDGLNMTNAGDIRLTAYGYYLPGSRVAACDTDINKNLTEFGKGWKIVFADQFGSTGYDLLDPVYIHVGGESSQIERLDIRLSDSANGPAGSLVDGLDSDRGISFSTLTYSIRYYNANGNVRSDGTALYDPPDQVYLDLSPKDGQGFVLVNDIRLT